MDHIVRLMFWGYWLALAAGLGMMGGYIATVLSRQTVRRLWIDAAVGVVSAAGGYFAFVNFLEYLQSINLDFAQRRELGGPAGAGIIAALLVPAVHRLGLAFKLKHYPFNRT